MVTMLGIILAAFGAAFGSHLGIIFAAVRGVCDLAVACCLGCLSVRQALQTELVTLNLVFLFYENIFKTNKNGSTSPAPALRGGPSTRPHKNKPTRKPSKPPELIFP